jgi:hypothetical protein
MIDSQDVIIPQNLRLLKDSEAGVRSGALNVLGMVYEPLQVAIPQMVPLLNEFSK